MINRELLMPRIYAREKFRSHNGGTLVWEPPLTVSRLKCLGPCMKRRVFIGFTSVS